MLASSALMIHLVKATTIVSVALHGRKIQGFNKFEDMGKTKEQI
jgi:hypothetical protein